MMAESMYVPCSGMVSWGGVPLNCIAAQGFTHVTAVPDTGSVGPLCSCAGL